MTSPFARPRSARFPWWSRESACPRAEPLTAPGTGGGA
jgi:hypothetical protein